MTDALKPAPSLSLSLSVKHRLSGIDLGPNRAAAARLTLNEQGENLRWFYFPFEKEEGQDFSRPRTKAPPLIISPKLYGGPQPMDWEDALGIQTTEKVSTVYPHRKWSDKSFARNMLSPSGTVSTQS